jgi:4-hydroxy-2-oxoheptanedioate aldolase
VQSTIGRLPGKHRRIDPISATEPGGHVRDNKLKRMFREGRMAVGITPPFQTPEAVELVGLAGFDFVFVDGEHTPLTPESCQALVRAAQLVEIEPVVRVPSNDPAVILSYLEVGTLTIQVPHVNTADDARRAIAAVRYPPRGVRGAGSTTRAADYGLRRGAADYFAWADEQTLMIPQLEEPIAVRNVDEIAAVEGLEALFIGSGDLALTMGYPGQRAHPDVLDAINTVRNAGLRAGIPVGGVGGDAAANIALRDQGYLFTLNSGGALLTSACRTLLDGIRK